MPEKEDVLHSAYMRRLVDGLLYWGHITGGHFNGAVQVTGLSLRLSDNDREDTLVVLKGIAEDGLAVVGFHGEPGMLDALAGAARRLKAGSIKWREDNFRD